MAYRPAVQPDSPQSTNLTVRRRIGAVMIFVGLTGALLVAGWPTFFTSGPGDAVLRVVRNQVTPRLPRVAAAERDVTGAPNLAALPAAELRRQAATLTALADAQETTTTGAEDGSTTTGPAPGTTIPPTTVPPSTVVPPPPGGSTTTDPFDLPPGGDPVPDPTIPLPACSGKLDNQLGATPFTATGFYWLSVRLAPVDDETAQVLGPVLAGRVRDARAALVALVYADWQTLPTTGGLAPTLEFVVDGAHACRGAGLVEVDRLTLRPVG